MSESSAKHKEEAPKKLRFVVFTVSTSRFQQQKRGESVKDVSGELMESMLKSVGHTVISRQIISDDKQIIKKALQATLVSSNVDAAVFCGGTGITKSDVTMETVIPFLEKVLPGFGEIFRRLSFDEVGSAAILSRAIAGVAKGKAVFCIPGSPDSVKLCFEKLILLEAGHLVKHARE